MTVLPRSSPKGFALTVTTDSGRTPAELLAAAPRVLRDLADSLTAASQELGVDRAARAETELRAALATHARVKQRLEDICDELRRQYRSLEHQVISWHDRFAMLLFGKPHAELSHRQRTAVNLFGPPIVTEDAVGGAVHAGDWAVARDDGGNWRIWDGDGPTSAEFPPERALALAAVLFRMDALYRTQA